MKKQKTLVSILIINYNNAKVISRSILSCLNQSYKKTEILVFDDQSSDNSKIILNKYLSKKKVSIYFNKEKKNKVASFDAMNGYNYLFQKSKGQIICLLDSDDYFHKNKVKEVVKHFSKNQKSVFVQNLPKIKINKNKFLYKKNKNSPLSFWPYLAPESCISFRKSFMKNFIKDTKYLNNKYSSVWLGFRLGVYAYFLKKNFANLNKNLTIYESLGESKKYRFMGKNWIRRRKESFDYLKNILKKENYPIYNLDYFATKLITKII